MKGASETCDLTANQVELQCNGMSMTRQVISRALLRQRGFTLVEVLVAMFLLAIAILGVGAVLNGQGGLAAGSSAGLTAITRASYLSTATMLAQEDIEQIKNVQYTIGPPAVDQITTINFPNQGYGAIVGFPGFRRTVTIQDNAPVPNTKTITVQVFFRPPSEAGAQEQGMQLMTIIARRP